MKKIVGVRFQTAGKIYYFSPKDYEVSRGSHVIVETSRGTEYGTVIFGPKEVSDEEVVSPLKEVIRVATPRDDEREQNNRFREREAFLVCKQKIREHNLDMKLIKAEYTFDNNKLLFYFTADGRVDFRELVKDLAGQFHTRIELRQIGVRDETKLIGGLGICGRELCCHTFLSDFAPVSIKMAKEQNLSLNPTKISGACGRLMCCLNNEAETYQYLNRNLPKHGAKVYTPDGIRGVVRNVNILRQTVKVMIEDGEEREIREYAVEDLLDPETAKEVARTRREEPKRSLVSTASGRNTDRQAEGRSSNREQTALADKDQRSGKDHREHSGDRAERSGGERSQRNERSGSAGRSGTRRKGSGNSGRSNQNDRRQTQGKSGRNERSGRSHSQNPKHAKSGRNEQKQGNRDQNERNARQNERTAHQNERTSHQSERNSRSRRRRSRRPSGNAGDGNKERQQ